MDYIKIAKQNYLEALKLILAYAPTGDAQVDSPDVIIEPMEPLVEKARDLLKKMDPSIFQGVRKIKVQEIPYYGMVESGPGKDPRVIVLNAPRIIREVKQHSAGSSEEEIAKQIATHLAGTIGHEKAHTQKLDEKGNLLPSEPEAEQAEKDVLNKLKNLI